MAALVTILVGQCGNQLGTEFFSQVASSASNTTDEGYQHAVSTSFFRRNRNETDPPQARCVMVDMEPKVIDACRTRAARHGLFTFGGTCVTKDEGSANNWAFGYYGQGGSREAEILSAIRAEVAHCDALGGFQVVHSVAGGTGSGVGCLVSDLLREAYPAVPVAHNVVWPFEQGEVMTQWINCALTLHVLDENSDGTLVLSNDAALAAIARGTAGQNPAAGKSRVGASTGAYADLNRVLGTQLSCLWSPKFCFSRSVAEPGQHGTPPPKHRGRTSAQANAPPSVPPYRHSCSIVDTLSALSLNPRRKFFEGVLSHTPSTSTFGRDDGWSGPLQSVARDLGRGGGAEGGLLVLRGADASTDGVEAALSLGGPFPLAVQASNAPVSPELGKMIAGFAAGVGDNFGVQVERCASVVEHFTNSGAFMHHYESNGVSSDHMSDALLHCWSIADSYNLQ